MGTYPPRKPGQPFTKVRGNALIRRAHEHGDEYFATMCELFDERAHLLYGFKSSSAFEAEYPDRQRFSRKDRDPRIVALTKKGMSTAAIAPMVGASKSTVAVVAATVQNRAVDGAEPAKIKGLDGRQTKRPTKNTKQKAAPIANVPAIEETSASAHMARVLEIAGKLIEELESSSKLTTWEKFARKMWTPS